jgi:hypothetical protein
LNLKRPVSVRISRQDYDLSHFPEKLFSISIDDAEYMQELIDKKQNKQKISNVTPVIQALPVNYTMDYYVLSSAHMRYTFRSYFTLISVLLPQFYYYLSIIFLLLLRFVSSFLAGLYGGLLKKKFDLFK